MSIVDHVAILKGRDNDSVGITIYGTAFNISKKEAIELAEKILEGVKNPMESLPRGY